jgi:hypothetical protein
MKKNMNTVATRAERKRDRHAGEHHQQGDEAEQHSKREHAHRRPRRKWSSVCSRTWSDSSVIPIAISPYGIASGGAHAEAVVCLSTHAS